MYHSCTNIIYVFKLIVLIYLCGLLIMRIKNKMCILLIIIVKQNSSNTHYYGYWSLGTCSYIYAPIYNYDLYFTEDIFKSLKQLAICNVLWLSAYEIYKPDLINQ